MSKVIAILDEDLIDRFIEGDAKAHHAAEEELKTALGLAQEATHKRDDGGTLVICDDEKHEPESKIVKDDFLLITEGTKYLDGYQNYPGKGTVVLTVKRKDPE